MSVNTATHHRVGFKWPRESFNTPLHEASRPKHKADPYDVLHAELAMDDEVFIAKLTYGTPAQILAVKALDEYPETSSEGDLKQRCSDAVRRAVTLIPEDTERFTPGVVECATRAITAALKRTRKTARVASKTTTAA
jgi:hypothetical protein